MFHSSCFLLNISQRLQSFVATCKLFKNLSVQTKERYILSEYGVSAFLEILTLCVLCILDTMHSVRNMDFTERWEGAM